MLNRFFNLFLHAGSLVGSDAVLSDERTYMNPADEEFFAAIGRLAISWSHIDTGLDFMIAVIYHNLGGHEIEEKPWSLSRKLKFLRKCFSRFESLARLKEICYPLLDEIAAASDMRQKIIHGFIISHQEGTGEATMIQLLRGGAPNEHIQFTVTALDILRAASAA